MNDEIDISKQSFSTLSQFFLENFCPVRDSVISADVDI